MKIMNYLMSTKDMIKSVSYFHVGRLLIVYFLLSIGLCSCGQQAKTEGDNEDNAESDGNTFSELLESISYEIELSDGFHWIDTEKGCKKIENSPIIFDSEIFGKKMKIQSVHIICLKRCDDYRRYVLFQGNNVKYVPGLKTEDLTIFAAKEAILQLAETSLESDPSVEFCGNGSSFSDGDACMYYLITGDSNVAPEIKRLAKAHYSVAVDQFIAQQNNLYMLDSAPGVYKFVFYPSQRSEDIYIDFQLSREGDKKNCLDVYSYKK